VVVEHRDGLRSLGRVERVACVGGPLDGAVIEIDSGVPDVQVTMEDGARHHYARGEDGGPRFSWLGRS
jgi:hypothetical protein